jgi:hypothetical protein
VDDDAAVKTATKQMSIPLIGGHTVSSNHHDCTSTLAEKEKKKRFD